MTGAMSRRKGAVAERAVVAWLQANGAPHAERRGAGFEAADIIGLPGVTFEVKNRAKLALPEWMRQLDKEMEADRSDVGVVIHKRPGQTYVGNWWATTNARTVEQIGGRLSTVEAEMKSPALDGYVDWLTAAPMRCVVHMSRGSSVPYFTMRPKTFMQCLAYSDYTE